VHRARKRSVAAAALLAAAAPGTAWAFHTGGTFDKVPGAGGADGIFFAGAPLEHGWTCTACHQDTPGQIEIHLDVQPASLFQGYAYTPGTTYAFTATMIGEHLGLGSPMSNYNSVAVEFVDAQGIPSGSITNAPQFHQTFGVDTPIMACDGKVPGLTSWSFDWTAPAAGAGTITLYLAAIDGNGANSPADQVLTDPFGDDFFSVAVPFTEAGGATGQLYRWTPSRTGTLACVVGIAAAGIAARRRRKR
jgi:hypothetical protein